jgi:hypothetical protein
MAGFACHPFDFASVACTQASQVHTYTAAGRAVRLVFAMAAAVFGLLPVQAAPALCEDGPPRLASVAALRPTEVALAIASPRAGEVAVEGPEADSITVAVEYWGPRLSPAGAAHAVDEYHLAYFLDDDASPYVGTLLAIPRCDPRIIHSTATHVTFDHVMHGSHSLQVLLIGSNDVSVNPPVATSVTFLVR